MFMDTVNNILNQIAYNITIFFLDRGINIIVEPWMVVADLLLILTLLVTARRRREERRSFLGSFFRIVFIAIALAALVFIIRSF